MHTRFSSPLLVPPLLPSSCVNRRAWRRPSRLWRRPARRALRRLFGEPARPPWPSFPLALPLPPLFSSDALCFILSAPGALTAVRTRRGSGSCRRAAFREATPGAAARPGTSLFSFFSSPPFSLCAAQCAVRRLEIHPSAGLGPRAPALAPCLTPVLALIPISVLPRSPHLDLDPNLASLLPRASP